MRIVIEPLLLSLFCGIAFLPGLPAQPQESDDLWPLIESQLPEQVSDTSLQFIHSLVRRKCGDDYSCLYQNYSYVQSNLERIFNLPAALYVGMELVRIAKRENALDDEAEAHVDQYRFFDATGDSRLSMTSLEKAGQLFEKTGNLSRLTYVKQTQLQNSLAFRDIDEVLPKMDSLFEQAKSRGDTTSITSLLIRLIDITKGHGRFEELENYLEDLDRISANKTGKEKHSIELRTTLARVELAQSRGDLAEAIHQCQNILKILEKTQNRWFEYHSLQLLAEMEWERGNRATAKSYLEQAECVAADLSLLMQLGIVYGIKSRFAEEEGQPAKALEYLKQKLLYEEEWKSRSEGFNMQAFYLEQDKEQLEVEKQRQQLELDLKNNQLRNSIAIGGLLVLLALSLGIGFYFQRKRKTELRQQNQLIQQQAERLRNLDETKSRFFANVSHELRTPLTLILGPIKSALSSGTLDNRNFTLLKKAQQSSEDLLKLVASILNLSKLEHGKLELKESAEPIFPLVQRIVSTFESHAERSGIELTFIYKAQKDLQLQIDREKVETILNNLLSNAFKFTAKSGKVSVTVADMGNALELVVEDSGRGISQNDLPKIFNRFYQSEEKNAPTEGGTGIGLALCQELVQLMGGSIRAESMVGKGSSFYVEIPRKEVMRTFAVAQSPDREFLEEQHVGETAQYAPMILKPDKDSNANGHRPTILIVEDNHSLRDYLCTILGARFHVLTAENGKEALEILQIQKGSYSSKRDIPPVSLVISDVMMPIMDGFQLMEKLKMDDRFNRLPLIMLTARADIRDKLKALRIGVDDYLLKPFDEEELLIRITNLLENYAIRQETLNEDAAPGKEIPAISEQDRQWLETFETYIKENISNEMVNVPDLARQFAMSESSLLRQLKYLTGLTPAKYLFEMRLDKARQLLENHVYNSISQVASEVGYQDAKSFSRSFKNRFGKSPSEFIGNG